MPAVAFATIIALASSLSISAGAQESVPTGGFDRFSPSGQQAILDHVAPIIAEMCGNFRAKTQYNKTFVNLSADDACATKLLEDRAMFEFVLADAGSRCEAHSRDRITTSRTPRIQMQLSREDMAKFATDALKPILTVNCR